MTGFVCDLAWVHLSVMPHSIASVCCVADHAVYDSRAHTGQRSLSAGRDSVISIINSDSYRKIRQQMLAGQVPEACRTCAVVEAAGGQSKRLKDGMKFNLDHAALTAADGSIQPDLRDIELRLGNYCNLACRGCNAESSTSWIQDWNKLKQVVLLPSAYDLVKQHDSTYYDWCEDPEFYRDLLNNAPRLRSLHISGGEPFLVPKHFRLLEFLLEQNRHDVSIHYITNLNYDFDRIRPALDMLRRFRRVDISFSIDDVGERNSYIRHNSDWQLTVENLRRFNTEYSQFNLSVTQTVMAYNFMYIEQLDGYLRQHGLMPRNEIVVNHIHAPECLQAGVLPLAVRQLKLDSIRGQLPARFYDNLVGRYYEAPAVSSLREFLRYTRALDAVRNQRLQDNFALLYETATKYQDGTA